MTDHSEAGPENPVINLTKHLKKQCLGLLIGILNSRQCESRFRNLPSFPRSNIAVPWVWGKALVRPTQSELYSYTI